VLQSLADSLAATAQNVAAAYKTALASIANLTAQLNAAQTDANAQVTTLTGQIATLTGAAATLQSQLADANNTIATRDATIATLNGTIATLNGQISAMVATPVPMSASPATAAVTAPITVTATFPVSQNGKTATFSATGGSFTATAVTISGGTATTTFSSPSAGTFNIYAVQGLYSGGAIVTITPAPAATYSISGTISLNGAGLQNVIVALTGVATNVATTNASGNYSFAGLQNGGYIVTPAYSGYSFVPVNASVTVSGANATGNNFTAHPADRFYDNNNGTVTDNTTGLVWLKDADCTQAAGGISKAGETLPWADAQTWAGGLADGTCGLSDGSGAGSWRVPTLDELIALTNGTEPVRWGTLRVFSNVWRYYYWSSSSYTTTFAWNVYVGDGTTSGDDKSSSYYVWPVRSGQ
jgi:hypothetical protein